MKQNQSIVSMIEKEAEKYAIEKYGNVKPDGHPLAGDTEDGINDYIAGRSKSIESEKAKDERLANLESRIKELQIRYGDNWTPYANEMTDKILNK